MKFSNATRMAAALSIATTVGFATALPAQAAVVGRWGDWDAMFLTVDFGHSTFPNATFTISGESTWNNLYPATEGEGFGADTPLGDLVGANADSMSPIFLKVSTVADNSVPAIVTITFDSPVPAEQLVLALSDVDSDRSVITMNDADGNPLTGNQIRGTATTTAFNFDDLSSTDKPTVVASGDSVTIGDAPDETDGSTGWVRPSVDVSSITIQIWTEDGNISSERIWLGQVSGTADPADKSSELASTGPTNSIYAAGLGALVSIAFGGTLVFRRRAR